ncbi:hypothetical protein LXA43DRAFT_558970 [Ganoderma leucocontextum]|nr:hypothetical protein LXA43DRAFT_558970 [Ganoderma leucocontextum]
MYSASTSTHPTSMSRPTPKRAAYTWPGTPLSRNHFEDFLREIGSNGESAHLCCVPKSATTHPHVHAHKRSTSNARSEARSSLSRPVDNARASSHDSSAKGSHHAQPQHPQAEKRGRTLPSPKVSGTLTSGLPVSLKSPALSSIDLESHDAAAAYDFFPSARDSLLYYIGHSPLDERPSRALTRTFRNHAASTSRSPDPQGLSSPSPSSSPASSRSRRESEQHSRTRSSARSSSRSPSIDSLDTASSSEAPATPKTQSMLPQDLPPVTVSPLEELERSSRFRVPCVCMTCKRAGSNYPSCGKCGEMWCSRECRTGAARTHVCHGRMVTAV